MINIGFFFGGIIVFLAEVYVLSKFYEKKFSLKNKTFYITVLLFIFLGMLNYSYANAFIRIIISVFLLGICNWIIFREKANELIVGTLFIYFITTISDIIGASILMIIFKNDAFFDKQEYFATFIGNIIVTIVFILISCMPITKKIYLKLIKLTKNIKRKSLVIGCLLFIISINFLMAFMYYNMNPVYIVIINSILLLIYSYIVYKTLNERNTNMVIKAENKSLMESLNEYENMVDRQRVDNHENKNQLLIIKNMIKKKDKDVVKYIDTIVKDEKEDDEALYTKVKTIPSGGLQGIIYQKMLTMKDNNIVFSLDVSREVRKIDLENFNMEDNYKLCKIVGVFLDNAIEESINIKDKCIMISLYIDEDMLTIDISNRFESDIDIEQLDKEGYTTKSKGHGYGLSLVKKIVSESDVFINERKINKNIFKQIIKVKIKPSE